MMKSHHRQMVLVFIVAAAQQNMRQIKEAPAASG